MDGEPVLNSVKTPAKLRILVRRADQRLRRGLDERLGTEPRAVLQHHLEAAGIADALHRRRRDGQDIGVLDHRQALAQIGQHRVRGHALSSWL